MPARRSSDLSRIISEHPELTGRYVYFCPTREISVAARFTEIGQLELLYDSSVHEYSRPILESLRNRLLHGDGGATANVAALVQTLGDAEGSADKLINLLYTQPHCRGKCLAYLWKSLKTPDPLKSNASSGEVMKLSKEDFLAMFSTENSQTEPIDIGTVMEPVQLREETPPPGEDCIGISVEPYNEYEQMSNEMNAFRPPSYVKKSAGFYRHNQCTGNREQIPNSGGLCAPCQQVKKAIDGLKAKTGDRYCSGIPKSGWIEDLQKIRPMPDLKDYGDRYRHLKCKKRKEGRSFAALRCTLCQLLKQRLVGRKYSRQARPAKNDSVNELNWLLYTNPKFLSGPELEQRAKLVKERKEKSQRDREAKRRGKLGLNADDGVRQRRIHLLKKPMRPKYVRMTMQLTNPQCEWGDCQERFA